MIDGSAPAPLLLFGVVFLWLIALCGLFFFLNIDDTLFKAYSWDVIRPSLSRRYVLVYLFFFYFPLVEFSHLFYIMSLIVCFVFLSVDCFILQLFFLKVGLV